MGMRRGDMDRNMIRTNYMMLGVNILLSFIAMYFLMFEMIWSSDAFFQNVNFFYMALTMAMPMGILMLLLMPMMYPDKRLNAILYPVFVIVLVLAFWGIRAQTFVGDKQFLRSMIPHHSAALTMCNRASLMDERIRTICFQPDGIVDSQTREINEMKAILNGEPITVDAVKTTKAKRSGS